MFGLLSLARDRAPSLLSVPIDCYLTARSGGLGLPLHSCGEPKHNNAARIVTDAARGFFMSTANLIQASTRKPQPAKTIPQAKVAPKPQPTGLSREEIRQIVLEMIG
jgi:hypothetical protein